VVVDIRTIPGLAYIKAEGNELKVGALTTLGELETSPVVNEKFTALAQAAHEVATPQIRNYGTIGGNLAQRPRCWYFRGPLFANCYKRGGDFCYAVTGENQYNAILEGELCYIVHPSDLAPALIALNAKVKIAGPKGERVVPLEEFFIGPRKDVLRENVLEADEIITEVQVPNPASNTKGVYLKFKERGVLDFAVASVAVVLTATDKVVQEARIVLGGVAPTPYRASQAEAVLKGKKVDDALVQQAGERAVIGARPMSLNAYKVDVVKALVKQAVLSAI